MTKALVSKHHPFHHVPQYRAHSPPSQFNRSHIFGPSCLLLNSKDMNIEPSILWPLIPFRKD